MGDGEQKASAAHAGQLLRHAPCEADLRLSAGTVKNFHFLQGQGNAHAHGLEHCLLGGIQARQRLRRPGALGVHVGRLRRGEVAVQEPFVSQKCLHAGNSAQIQPQSLTHSP